MERAVLDTAEGALFRENIEAMFQQEESNSIQLSSLWGTQNFGLQTIPWNLMFTGMLWD